MTWEWEGDTAHTGYPVALVQVPLLPFVWYRELGYPDPEVPPRVTIFQIACECGWRSRRYYAPLTAVYEPFTLDLCDPLAEKEAHSIWVRHCRDEVAAAPARSRLLAYNRGG